MIRVPPGGKVDSLPRAPYFLPDPRSGSLYLLGTHGQLKKLPFSIPKLVSMAPCRSSEGLYYSGRKVRTSLVIRSCSIASSRDAIIIKVATVPIRPDVMSVIVLLF